MNDVVVEDCCKSYCAGCPWADEQKKIDKEKELERAKKEV